MNAAERCRMRHAPQHRTDAVAALTRKAAGDFQFLPMPTISRHHRRCRTAPRRPESARLRHLLRWAVLLSNTPARGPRRDHPLVQRRNRIASAFTTTGNPATLDLSYALFLLPCVELACGRRDHALGDRIEFHYVGHLPDWLPEMADAFGLGQLCTRHGLKPEASETQGILEGGDAFAFSTSIKVLDGEDYCLASKTFDYICGRQAGHGVRVPGHRNADFLAGSEASRCCSTRRTLRK